MRHGVKAARRLKVYTNPLESCKNMARCQQQISIGDATNMPTCAKHTKSRRKPYSTNAATAIHRTVATHRFLWPLAGLGTGGDGAVKDRARARLLRLPLPSPRCHRRPRPQGARWRRVKPCHAARRWWCKRLRACIGSIVDGIPMLGHVARRPPPYAPVRGLPWDSSSPHGELGL